jgi:hypothetical protein
VRDEAVDARPDIHVPAGIVEMNPLGDQQVRVKVVTGRKSTVDCALTEARTRPRKKSGSADFI